MKLSLKEIIKENHVKFREYRKGILYYQIAIVRGVHIDSDDGGLYVFQVPIDDCGDATFKCNDKAIYFMRYIRKALDEGTFNKV